MTWSRRSTSISGASVSWFLLPVEGKGAARFEDSISEVRKRLRRQGDERESRDQVVAGLDFGFWSELFHSGYDELWKKSLHKAFPHSSGKRSDVVAALETLRLFHNRLAHHDSLLQVDVRFRLSQMRDVLAWVDPGARAWFDRVERVTEVLNRRPLQRTDDVVVVAAGEAWPFYQATGAYVCQAGRSFRPVERLAFYSHKEIHADVPLVHRRVDHVDWSRAEVNRLRRSSSDDDQKMAEIIVAHLGAGWPEGRNQVFVLSRPGQRGHEKLARPISNLSTGRGSAFTQSQRYTTLQAMLAASSTADL